MRTAIRILLLSMTILTLTAATTWATHTVYAPNYPTLAQLESGWNDAFVSWLTNKYGGSPTIISTTTYAGQDGQIFVVSSFTAGVVSGKILGRAFDPVEATSLGSGAYQYQVQANGAFTCTSNAECVCEPHERRYPDGSYERWCETGRGGSTLTPAGNFVGSYQIRPNDYGSLPTMN